MLVDEIEKILCELGLSLDNDRQNKILMQVANFSRIINRRNGYDKIDFNHVRRYLYLHSKAMYVKELNDFNVPEIGKVEDDVDEETEDDFGMPENEF